MNGIETKTWIETIEVRATETDLKVTCTTCHRSEPFRLHNKNLRRWIHGEHIQNVWPEMPSAQRELLISGTCGACFDEMFKDYR